ncbi:T9SS type A sorting domain-containing protein [Hymenobacter sp. UYAg731]
MVWGVTSNRVAGAIPTTYIRSNNAAGDQFDWGDISVTQGPSNSATVGNISGISATTAVACAYPGSTFDNAHTSLYGGEIVKTTNGGQTWTKKTTPAQFQGGFCNWVHMFDATTGVALGDPTGGAFEILRTTDGGDNWVRLTSNIPTPLTDEYGNAGAFFSIGNTIWVGMASQNQTSQVRVFKSTDKGLTWTASTPTPITYLVDKIAFKDANNGIAYGYNTSGTPATISSITYARTSDGGATWTQIAPNNTPTGSLFRFDIDAVNGVYYSVGQRFPASAPAIAEDFGSSYSTDGVNWTNMTTSQGYFSADFIAGTTSGSVVGYGGAATDVNGVGGIYKFSRTSPSTATRNAALQSALNVYPNPSASGVFNVDLGSELKTGALLTVSDALGRLVKSQTLNAATIGSHKISLDLSGEKTGVYTLQIRTDAGLATQKVVIE